MNQLEKFQKDNGLNPDGVIGKITLGTMKQCFNIETDEEVSHYAAQITHETANFKYETENLKYSAAGLLSVFGKYFTASQAKEFAYKPEKIANRVYANRMGNGDECSGDGWKYRGRGSLQLTGKNNYESFANKKRDLRIIDNPDLVIEEYFFDSSLFYFDSNNVWRYCKEVNYDSIRKVTRLINGGENGLQERVYLTNKYYNALGHK